jgi:hypothetical protein
MSKRGSGATGSVGSGVPMGLTRPRPSVPGTRFFEVVLGHTSPVTECWAGLFRIRIELGRWYCIRLGLGWFIRYQAGAIRRHVTSPAETSA